MSLVNRRLYGVLFLLVLLVSGASRGRRRADDLWRHPR